MFPFANSRRKTIKAPVNPLDRSTVVSIFPKDICENKPTIQPGVFRIPAGSFEKPAILVVGPSSWWREIDEEQPLLEIPNSSIQIADSIIRDFCIGLLGVTYGSIMPGMFYVLGTPGITGEIKEKDINSPEIHEKIVSNLKKEHLDLLLKAKFQQDEYWKSLVRLADIGWARTNGNPLCIADDMRLAARELNLTTKDWMKDFSMMSMVKCPACGVMVNPGFPICGNCKTIINKEKAKELNLEFAK